MISDPREQLQWEKELIGLYVSDHPLTSFMPFIQQKVTHYSADLAQAADHEKVTVAGIITKMRRLNTKNGNQMAFATLEDLQGSVELVIFPKVWEKQGSLVQPEAVLLTEGKIDSASGDPKILVDRFRLIRPDDVTDEMRQDAQSKENPEENIPLELNTPGLISINEDGVTFEEPPIPLDEMDWHFHPPAASSPQLDPPTREVAPVIETPAAPSTTQPVAVAETAVVTEPPAVEIEFQRLPAMVSPVPPLSNGKSSGSRQLITITLTASGEKERDVRRMKRIHGLINSYPGDDRFCFLVYERGRQHLLDFPNDTTAATHELLDKLVELVGQENIQVETV
jgi:DNA polymerase-3 subunit alpha